MRHAVHIFLLTTFVLTACSAAQATPAIPPPAPIEASPTAPAAPTPAAPSTTEAAAPPTDEAPAPAEAVLFNGIPQGITDEGFPYLGDPRAPVTLIDYSDFL
jgi:hypothetical protein